MIKSDVIKIVNTFVQAERNLQHGNYTDTTKAGDVTRPVSQSTRREVTRIYKKVRTNGKWAIDTATIKRRTFRKLPPSVITAKQERYVRVCAYNKIIDYHRTRMTKADFGRFKKSVERIMFDDFETTN